MERSNCGSAPSKNNLKKNAVKSNSLQYKSNYKVLWIDSKRFIYRCDGICKENPKLSVSNTCDPRNPLLQFRRRADLDLIVPSFILDNNSVGPPIKREVSIIGLNDNVNEVFLKNICRKCGELFELSIFYHPVTKKHLGLAYVVFRGTDDAKNFISKYDGVTLMGSNVMCFLDPYASEISRRFEVITGIIARVPIYLENIDYNKLRRLREEFVAKPEKSFEHINFYNMDNEGQNLENGQSISRQDENIDEETPNQSNENETNDPARSGSCSPLLSASGSIKSFDEVLHCPPPPPIPPPPPPLLSVCPPPPSPHLFSQSPLYPPLCVRSPIPLVPPPFVPPRPFDSRAFSNHFPLPMGQSFHQNWPGFSVLPPPLPVHAEPKIKVELHMEHLKLCPESLPKELISTNLLTSIDETSWGNEEKLQDDTKIERNIQARHDLKRNYPRPLASEFPKESDGTDCIPSETASSYKKLRPSHEENICKNSKDYGKNRNQIKCDKKSTETESNGKCLSTDNGHVLQEVRREEEQKDDYRSLSIDAKKPLKFSSKSEKHNKTTKVKVDSIDLESVTSDEKASCSKNRKNSLEKRKMIKKRISHLCMKKRKLTEDLSEHRWSSTSSSDDYSEHESSTSFIHKRKRQHDTFYIDKRRRKDIWDENLEDVSESDVSSREERSKFNDGKEQGKLRQRSSPISDPSARFSIKQRLETLFSSPVNNDVTTSPQVDITNDDNVTLQAENEDEIVTKQEKSVRSPDCRSEPDFLKPNIRFPSDEESIIQNVENVENNFSMIKRYQCDEEDANNIKSEAQCGIDDEVMLAQVELNIISTNRDKIVPKQKTSKSHGRRSINKHAGYDPYLKGVFANIVSNLITVLINDLKKKIEISVFENVEEFWSVRSKSFEQTEDNKIRTSSNLKGLILQDESDKSNILASLDKPTFAHSSKNALQEMMQRFTAESKAEIGAVIEPDTASLLGTGFFFQGFSKNMPSFKRKISRKQERSIRSSSVSSSVSATSCASTRVTPSANQEKEGCKTESSFGRQGSVDRKYAASPPLTYSELNQIESKHVDNNMSISDESDADNGASDEDIDVEKPFSVGLNCRAVVVEKKTGEKSFESGNDVVFNENEFTNDVASHKNNTFNETKASVKSYEKSIYDSIHNDHCYFAQEKPKVKKVNNCAPEDLISPILFSRKPQTEFVKVKERKRTWNELASLLPPPVDVRRFSSGKEWKPKEHWKTRNEIEKKQIVDKFLEHGFDEEDLKYLEQAFHEMQNNGTAEWNRQLYWVPNQATPHIKASDSLSRHQSGCIRAEGYYKISQKQKIRGMRRVETSSNINGRDETAIRQLAQATREARSMNRRLLTSIGETSDIFKVNQLKYRKKMIKFARSRIHGWGLFSLEDICPDEMIIEYVGQKVRPTVADEREKRYERLGMGSSYLFRIDSDTVVDATRMGNFARFINHSCQPNCYAKIVAMDGDKRIVIYSKIQINKGDEITYDYKFPIEEDKIDCLCGAPCCRRSLN